MRNVGEPIGRMTLRNFWDAKFVQTKVEPVVEDCTNERGTSHPPGSVG